MKIIKSKAHSNADGFLDRIPWFQFGLLATLFGLWAIAASLNDILITNFRSLFELSNLATAFVQTAFYLGYFVVAIPVSRFIRRYTYRQAIITGLIFYIIGCSLFFPASHSGTYAPFLFALFVVAVGLSFLETSANTYAAMMGPKSSSTRRLTIAQTFYPIGSIAGVLMGKYLIFGSGATLEDRLAAATNLEEKHKIAEEALQATLHPYLLIIAILVVVLILFIITEFPSCKPTHGGKKVHAGIGETLVYLFKDRDFKIGIVTQFIYMALQTAVWSYIIRLALDVDGSLNERTASNFLIAAFVLLFLGRASAAFLMGRFRPPVVLTTYSVLGLICMIYVTFGFGLTPVYAAVLSVLFFAPCWPAIYGETLKCIGDSRYVETGGAIIVMSIVGGAVGPVLQGAAADIFGSMQVSFIVPAACYVVVLAYFIYMIKAETKYDIPSPEDSSAAVGD